MKRLSCVVALAVLLGTAPSFSFVGGDTAQAATAKKKGAGESVQAKYQKCINKRGPKPGNSARTRMKFCQAKAEGRR